MISEATGNLLADDAEALVNTVNTVGVMGKGIALQFKRAYPDMFRDYERAAKVGQLQIGRMHVWATGAMAPRFIINFPTKRHWREASRVADIDAGLADLVRVVDELGIRSIAIPPLGCGNGGLDWGIVVPRIEQAFASLDEVDVRVYPPAGAPPAAAMVNRQRPPRMTPVRAALLGLMVAYHQLTWEWPTPLETQKLAYFLQDAGLVMRLDYARGPYGPYADNLRKTLRELEGHYILGFGDGSGRPLEAGPVEVTALGARASQEALQADDEADARFKRVFELVCGFETAYGLELLASVHWAASHEEAATSAAAGEAVRGWTRRKASLFTQDHVDVAWKALNAGGWLRSPALVT